MVRLCVRVPVTVLERVDGIAAERGLSRSGAVRTLLEAPVPERAPADRHEALVLLSEAARDGSVTARVTLARLVAQEEADPVRRRRDELAARRRARAT
jgi:metal-responsive CopG/Arc/MetJ family transcriptional regulator